MFPWQAKHPWTLVWWICSWLKKSKRPRQDVTMEIDVSHIFTSTVTQRRAGDNFCYWRQLKRNLFSRFFHFNAFKLGYNQQNLIWTVNENINIVTNPSVLYNRVWLYLLKFYIWSLHHIKGDCSTTWKATGPMFSVPRRCRHSCRRSLFLGRCSLARKDSRPLWKWALSWSNFFKRVKLPHLNALF